MLTFITRISHSFMFILNMFNEMTSVGCRKLTFVAWITYSFMLILNMHSEITTAGCRKLAFITGISHSFLFIINMFSAMTPAGCRILTFITWIMDISLLCVYYQYVLLDDFDWLQNTHIYHMDISLHLVSTSLLILIQPAEDPLH